MYLLAVVYMLSRKKTNLATAEHVLLTTPRTAPVAGKAGRTQQVLQHVSRTYPAQMAEDTVVPLIPNIAVDEDDLLSLLKENSRYTSTSVVPLMGL